MDLFLLPLGRAYPRLILVLLIFYLSVLYLVFGLSSSEEIVDVLITTGKLYA